MTITFLLFLFSLLIPPADGSVILDKSTRATIPNVTSTSKAGLAWSNGNFDDYTQYTSTGKVSWYYTWSINPIRANLEFVPMLWGQDQAQSFHDTINNTITSHKVTAVLGMNEPQQTGQSNLTPEQGADLWKTYIEPLKAQGLRLGSPAPSGAPSGKTWLQDWLSTCNGGCNPDFIALHWYDVNSTNFIQYLEDFHDTFKLPLWVTEWSCQNFNNGPQCTEAEIFQFLNITQSFMDATDWVERYAWFGVMEDLQGVNEDDAMMTPHGQINALGQQYIGLNSDGPQGPTVAAGAGRQIPLTINTSSFLRTAATLSIIALITF